jgi:CheY-like chemotaxis protein
LVVDDEPLNLELIAEHLSDPRYRLYRVPDGIQAWEVLQQDGQEFDLVVLDRMMPGMSGMELLAHVRGDRRFIDMPVIMQTAASRPHEILEGISQGVYYYLAKPYDHQLLVAVVGAAIDFRARVKDLRRRLADVQDVFSNLQSAQFTFSTLTEALRMASFLAKLCPAPEVAVIGLAELMINAVEHGNLDIGYADKGRLSLEGVWSQEVERRLMLPEYRDRVATARFERLPDRLVFRIGDQGSGFDWKSFMDTPDDRAFDMHGRGIAMARTLAFDTLSYNDGGRVAVASICTIPKPRHPPQSQTPST